MLIGVFSLFRKPRVTREGLVELTRSKQKLYEILSTAEEV
jgi:hypothetical protein